MGVTGARRGTEAAVGAGGRPGAGAARRWFATTADEKTGNQFMKFTLSRRLIGLPALVAEANAVFPIENPLFDMSRRISEMSSKFHCEGFTDITFVL